jgi:myo-inositol-1(or 4)-monophosphatase
MDSELQTAIDAAHAAGELLRRKLPLERQVRYKGPRDIVTDADEAAQRAIIELIGARFPEHEVLAEESPRDLDLAAAGPTWIIDPLDGTTNYARRYPSFCVSVGLADAGALRVGAICDPIRRETFYAATGQGAFLQRGRARAEPLRVTDTGDLVEALVGVDWARDPEVRAQVLAVLGRVASSCRSVRASGSAALALAYVAAGWLDAYFHFSLSPWDVAAGALLIQEAGGHITTPHDGPWQLGQPAIAASNGLLHAAFLETIG